MTSILKVDEIQNTDGKTGIVITPDGTVTVPSVKFPEITGGNPSRVITNTKMSSYEEGTWIPRLLIGASSTGITYSEQVGHYVKVGRAVTIIYRIVLSNKSTRTGEVYVDALPFRASDVDVYPAVMGLWHDVQLPSVSGGPQVTPLGQLAKNSVIIRFYYCNAGSASSFNQSVLTNTSVLNGTCTYLTDE